MVKDTGADLAQEDEDDRTDIRILQDGPELERGLAIEFLDNAKIGSLAFQ